MNQQQLMVQTDPSKPYLGIVGCSYSHWFYGDCELKSYPALIAKKFPQYNIIDLSIISGSNESAFFRLHNFEQKYKIKFSKIVWQLTHFCRELVMIDYKNNDFVLQDIKEHGNYFYTEGHYEKHYNFAINIEHVKDNMNKLVEYFDIKKTDLYKYYVNKFASNQHVWLLQKEIDHINSHYGEKNVLIFSWHTKIDLESTSKNFFAYDWETGLGHAVGNKSNETQDLEFELPKNYIGAIQDMFGNDKFWKLGVDDSPHYGSQGHAEVFDVLHNNVVKLIEG